MAPTRTTRLTAEAPPSSAAALTTVALRQPAPDRAAMAGVTLDRTWREESADPCDTPWYLDHRWVSLALLVLTVAVVVPFR